MVKHHATLFFMPEAIDPEFIETVNYHSTGFILPETKVYIRYQNIT
jgi:hypothetical protein